MMTRSLKIALFAVVAFSVITSGARIAGAGYLQDKGSKSMSDRDFVRKAIRDDMMSVSLGQMAWKQASLDKVRKFGRQMAATHGRAEKDLMAIADRIHIDYPKGMDRVENYNIELMSTLKGSEFDKAYMRHVIVSHQKSLHMFETMARDASNPELKNYARKETKALRSHLDKALKIDSKLHHKD